MKRFECTICVSLILLFSVGCSDEVGKLGSTANPLIDGQDKPRWARQLENGVWDYFGRIKNAEADAVNCRVKYHDSHSTNQWMVAKGTINGDHQYPVVLDTGASQPIFIDKKHVRDNNLDVYSPPNINTESSQNWSLCNMTELSIGSVTLSDWPCFYRDNFSLLGMLGIRNAAFDSVILGLPVLREFKYIVFDGIRREIEFSLKDSFRPDDPNRWRFYDIFIEEDLAGNAFLFVKTTIASVPVELQLDTGSGRGLAVSQSLWSEIAGEIGQAGLKKAREYYPYIGNLSCKRTVIDKLEFGGRDIKKAPIAVFDDDSPLVDGCDGLVGMAYFTSAVIVLDFENELLWVKSQ